MYVGKQFEDVNAALQTLYDKVENGEANREDAYAVKAAWADKKKKLHIFLPHNDLTNLDYYLAEACAFIYREQYDLALGKLEALLEITANLPSAYKVTPENVF